MGVPEEEAHYYETAFQSGRALVTVRAGERYQEASDILHRHGGRKATIPASDITETPGRGERIDRPYV